MEWGGKEPMRRSSHELIEIAICPRALQPREGVPGLQSEQQGEDGEYHRDAANPFAHVLDVVSFSVRVQKFASECHTPRAGT
jgi:hypothetical protein